MIKLVSITKGSGELEGKTAQEIISYCARVSNPDNQLNFEAASKLLRYCIKHKHWSIFEQADMTIEIVTSRAIAAQILRHKTFNFQEFSQRYQQVTRIQKYQARRQDTKNRQNSFDDLEQSTKDWFDIAQQKLANDSMELYNEAINKGIAKECARFLLPLATETRLYMKGSIRSWITYLMVRLDKSTQKEHRDIAEECWNIFKEQLPDISEALIEEYGEVFN